MKNICLLLIITVLSFPQLFATEYHVSPNGSDQNSGSSGSPFKTIMAAAQVAMPGDTITVHAGTYRERITPPRGGTADKRITYRAAKGEDVYIKGSEIITGWKPFKGSVWMVAIMDTLFKRYNPYKKIIDGDWYYSAIDFHTGEVYMNGTSFNESSTLQGLFNNAPGKLNDTSSNISRWYCEGDQYFTYIYADFKGQDPNKETVEINVRPTCFYPDSTGLNYITIQGFHMSHAATQWAAPTAEQIGLIGTFWSKGWIIENNIISDSKCVGITLGKDKKSGDNLRYVNRWGGKSLSYNDVIKKAIDEGWNKDKVGSHIVRNNTIFNCEQAGICGSLGAAFSTISDNHIYNIHVKKLFDGSEMAAIKFHAPIDVTIEHNRLHNSHKGLWLDWMTQGTRISRNLFYNNFIDFESEVNHGPYLVDNNIFLSDRAILDMSEGGAFVHNLINGSISGGAGDSRETPYHAPHATTLVKMVTTTGGDDRFYNNIFSCQKIDNDTSRKKYFGLEGYNTATFPVNADGNIYLNTTTRYGKEINYIIDTLFDPQIKIKEKGKEVYLSMKVYPKKLPHNKLVNTPLLGKAIVPDQLFELPDGSSYTIATDFFNKKRNIKNPSSGPFESTGKDNITLRVW
jgi:hypothetical protein